ncbi:mitochondrial import inner membrane translocase subunit Tim23 [Centruroides vittatus]|uniref:mitochondrial import inner membrane translocase subunit Tim23-like n=1 Tax=Centruroides sculpturatus TaxID=218467 RepID=UPI000C6E5FF6|nr:mitochondrial import inner membrane translocase subunit Tim23-like [Centruroides sculpturatus]
MDKPSNYLNLHPVPDSSFQFPQSSGNIYNISPYLNVDPTYITQGGGPEWIFPEGASRQRGRFELAFSQIGGAVATGATIGGIHGFYTGWKETAAAGMTKSIRRTQMLNYITKQGAGTANSLGVVAVMYSGFGVLFSWLRGVDDELNTLTAATATGLLYKSSAGLRRCALGGTVGFGLAAIFCFWTSRDRLRQILQTQPA